MPNQHKIYIVNTFSQKKQQREERKKNLMFLNGTEFGTHITVTKTQFDFMAVQGAIYIHNKYLDMKLMFHYFVLFLG